MATAIPGDRPFLHSFPATPPLAPSVSSRSDREDRHRLTTRTDGDASPSKTHAVNKIDDLSHSPARTVDDVPEGANVNPITKPTSFDSAVCECIWSSIIELNSEIPSCQVFGLEAPHADLLHWSGANEVTQSLIGLSSLKHFLLSFRQEIRQERQTRQDGKLG
jgi:hypothetical protein